jgi:quinoprotein glucose dehydrogenase
VIRFLAVIFLCVGAVVASGGAYLLSLGGSPYYVLFGVAVLATAILLWQRKAASGLVYGLTLLATVAWAIWESGYDAWALVPRLVAPAIAGIVFLLPFVHRELTYTAPAWSTARKLVVLVIAVALGAALRTFVPPHITVDPIYQAGTTTAQAPSPVPAPENAGEWHNYGNDPGGSRFSSLTQLTPENVGKLQVAWRAHIGPTLHGLEGTPVMVDRTLYVCNGVNDIIALDAETGKEKWRFNAHADTHVPNPTCRGVAYYKTPNATGPCAERVITATIDARLIAVDVRDGKPCADFGTNGEVSLLTGMGDVVRGYYYVTSEPTVVHGKVVIGGNVSDNQYWGEPSGVIRAFDAVTGQLAWAWDMGHPDRTGLPPEGESYTRATPNSWGHMSADEKLGMVYVPTGNATPDYFGAQRRPFDDQYASSVVALDADTGRPHWSFQTAHHDLWDYDVAHQPSLVDFPDAQGKIVNALVLPTKRGELFILDRATGAPIYPIEERPAPQNGHNPDDRLSATQPFPTGIPSFRGADLTEDHMWGLTPVDQLWCRIKFRQARYEGPLTPPGLTPAIEYPGYAGGMEWGSATIDVSRRIAIVNTLYMPIYTRMLKRAEADARGLKRMTPQDMQIGNEGEHGPQEETPYGILTGPFLSGLHVPCNQPPYGRLSAMDLTTGKLIWTERFGTARNSGPFQIPLGLPFTIGAPNIGGGFATQTGLFFIGATSDKYIHAYDTATGKLLWQDDLPSGGNANPITYISPESGRQFVVIAAGGSGAVVPTSQLSDEIVAYALPKDAVK